MADAVSLEAQLVDFYNGAHLLEMIASWAYVLANPQTVLDGVASFEKTYEELVELHAAGKLGVGAADFSRENLERVKLLGRLLRPGFGSIESREAIEEIQALAERCVRGLKHSAS
jgi:hypothetical protein